MAFQKFFARKANRTQKQAQTPQTEPLSHIPYALPNNIQEVNRLDFQHYMLRYALENNFLAPITSQQASGTILDIGCGTGRWVLEMAQQFPYSHVIGIDHVAPSSLDFPPRCSFKIGNVLDGLPFPTNSFQFVHQRLLVLALPVKQWSFVLDEIVRVTCPGGWVELVESDGMFTHIGQPETATSRLNEIARAALKQRSIDVLQVRNIPTLLESKKLQNVQTHSIMIPTGRWGGRLGQMSLTNTQSALNGLKPLICAFANMSDREYENLLALVYQEFEEFNTSLQFTITYGQKAFETA